MDVPKVSNTEHGQETQARCDSIIIVTVVVVAVSALPVVGGDKSP